MFSCSNLDISCFIACYSQSAGLTTDSWPKELRTSIFNRTLLSILPRLSEGSVGKPWFLTPPDLPSPAAAPFKTGDEFGPCKICKADTWGGFSWRNNEICFRYHVFQCSMVKFSQVEKKTSSIGSLHTRCWIPTDGWFPQSSQVIVQSLVHSIDIRKSTELRYKFWYKPA